MISIAGVTVGTALLIVVLSVFNGFFEVIKNMLLSNDPDLRVEIAEGRSFLFTDDLEQSLADIPEIAVVSPYIAGKALIAHRSGRNQVVQVKGIDPDRFAMYANLDALELAGGLDLEVRNRVPGVLFTESLSRSLRIVAGDQVSLLSASGMRRALTQFTGPRISRFEVRGIFDSRQILDEPVIYIERAAAQRLFNLGNHVSGVDIRLHDHNLAETAKLLMQDRLGDKYRIQTWYDLQRPLYDVMNLEKWGAYFILMIIVLVAVLNIVGTLTMVVIQKQRDIGLLRSIGFRKKDVLSIFLRQGWYIGITGCTLGGGTGLLLCYLQDTFEMVKLAGSESFIISAYPVQVLWPDVAFVLGGSLVLCVLASWYPAYRAASIQPADSVRNE